MLHLLDHYVSKHMTASIFASVDKCDVVTSGVAAWESGDSHQVYAVNYADGLAARAPDGTWTRMTTNPRYYGWRTTSDYAITDADVTATVVMWVLGRWRVPKQRHASLPPSLSMAGL